MSLKDECSLKDTTELRQLIIKNPDLPLLIFVSDEAYEGEYCYNTANPSGIRVKELTLYNGVWLDRDDYEEVLGDELADSEVYKELSNKEFCEMIHKKVESAEYVKAIVIYI